MAINDLNVRETGGAIVAGFQESVVLDADAIRDIGAALNDLVEENPQTPLVLDLSAVSFVSSAALGMLISLRRKVYGQASRVLFAAPREEIVRLFHITSLDRLFELFPTPEAALQALGNSAGSSTKAASSMPPGTC